MELIAAGKESVVRLLPPHAETENGRYRLSRYTVTDGRLVYHSLTGLLGRATQEELRFLSELPQPYRPQMEELVRWGILVPYSCDEVQQLRRLRRLLGISQRAAALCHFTILPTTRCNAHCLYCYQSGLRSTVMDEKTAEACVEFITRESRGQSVGLRWFGGEPLFGIETVRSICRGLKERSVRFHSQMITNGILFTQEMIEEAVSDWQLDEVQITLDGTAETYCRVKGLAGNGHRVYENVLENIERLLESGVRVLLRLNLGADNGAALQALAGELAQRFAQRNGLRVYAAILFDGEGYEPVQLSGGLRERLNREKAELELRLEQLGLAAPPLASLRAHCCTADCEDGVVIDPEGGLCSCEHAVLTERFGTVFEPYGRHDRKEAQLIEPEQCRDCPLAPCCVLLRDCPEVHVCTGQEQRNRLAACRRAMKRMEEKYEAEI